MNEIAEQFLRLATKIAKEFENIPGLPFAEIEITEFPRPSVIEEKTQQPDSGIQSGQVTGQVEQLLLILANDTLPREAIQKRLHLQSLSNFRERYLMPPLSAGLIEYTIPDKPNSRLQQYRITPKGQIVIPKQTP